MDILCRMARIVTSLPEEAMINEWGNFAPGVALTLNAPGMEPLHVPLQSPDGFQAEITECTCWDWTGLAKDEGDSTNSVTCPWRMTKDLCGHHILYRLFHLSCYWSALAVLLEDPRNQCPGVLQVMTLPNG